MSNDANSYAAALYSLECGEMTRIEGHWVTRVPGGWIFASEDEGSVFVPFSNEFQRTDRME